MYYSLFAKEKNRALLKAFQCGIERESLRITTHGKLSKRSHPKALGAPLTHPHISTDFSEQQIEWNTPPLNSFEKVDRYLEEIMHFSLERMHKELLWPYSMPPDLNHIEIAHFGSSYQGKNKEIYRLGLKERYGSKLQMISGIHFNLSFDKALWEKIHRYENASVSLQDFIDEKYLGIIRNFLREGWLLTYLFGASPAMDRRYTDLPKYFKQEKNYYYAPYGTSIRTSHLGYYSRVQNQLAISLNNLNAYLSELKTAIQSQTLQSENEHYSRIRPKRTLDKKERAIEALENRGIEYLEVRAIDLNPSCPTGICLNQLKFIHLFLLYCLFKKSPSLTKKEQQSVTRNQNDVAIQGRNPDLILNGPTPISLKNWGRKILKKMEPLATLLNYEKQLFMEKEKIENPDRCLSATILANMREQGFHKTGVSLAKSHKQTILKKRLSIKKEHIFEALAQSSHTDNQRLETASNILVEGYETMQLSTQVLIRTALKRQVNIQILDADDQILRLEKNGHIEYVKEATKTSKDSYITPLLLENKEITKRLLLEKGLSVPIGTAYSSINAALADYPVYQKKKIVIKPKSTNFGLGVSFIEPYENRRYDRAIKNGFLYGSSVLVETFCPGKEYRFLVIDGKVVGVAERDPANVIGDGKHTIKALVQQKNHDPNYYRDPKTYIRLGKDEKEMLHAQKMTAQTVPQKGKKIYLRRNSNVSTGGDSIDVTDTIHTGYQKIATQAATIFGAKICGIDMMIPHLTQAPTKKNYAIIELNYNPVLFIHDYPYKGKRREVAGPLLDLLGYPK